MKYLYILLYSFLILTLSACGGGSGGGGRKDTLIVNMAPLRIIAFNDDGQILGPSLYPITQVGILSVGDEALIRVFDPYMAGDFYSIEVSHSFSATPHTAMPLAADGEPDNSPIEATILPRDTFMHRGLSPAGDEDWFIHTAVLFANNIAFTKANASGASADPVMEIYDSRLNPGPVTYREECIPGGCTIVAAVFDPTNNGTLVTTANFTAPAQELNAGVFSFVFSGPAQPGNYPVIFAAPPLPANTLGSVTGFVNVDSYGGPGQSITGTYDITIIDISRTTTVSGSFDVIREKDDSGLLIGLRPQVSGKQPLISIKQYQNISAYQRKMTSRVIPGLNQ